LYAFSPIYDEHKVKLMFSLVKRFGAPQCVVAPNRIRWTAYACEWPARDLDTQLTVLGDAISEIEQTYQIKCRSLMHASLPEISMGPRSGQSLWMAAWEELRKTRPRRLAISKRPRSLRRHRLSSRRKICRLPRGAPVRDVSVAGHGPWCFV